VERPIVLLGETHDNPEHHRWQLHVLAALLGRTSSLVIGFESFPRRAQPVLDRWTNGELDVDAFLKAVAWREVWAYDPAKAKQLLDAARADGVAVDAEITLLGRIGIYPNSTEVMEAIMAMYQGVGLNVKLKMLEVAEWVDILTKPYAEDRGPVLQQSQHDNNNGDAVFTVYNKYHSEGAQSTIGDPKLDDVIVRAGKATGDERRALFQQAFAIINEQIVADVPMYHMVGYTRVGKRINFKPSISTNSELQLAHMTFK